MWRPRKPQPPITRTELGFWDGLRLAMVANGWETWRECGESVGVRSGEREGGGTVYIW